MLRLPPTPGPTLASEGDPAPSRVRTEDFSASRFDFRTEVAICCWVLPACIEIKLKAKLATSIHVAPVSGDAIRQGLTKTGDRVDLPGRNRLVAAIVVETALRLAAQPAGFDIFHEQRARAVL